MVYGPMIMLRVEVDVQRKSEWRCVATTEKNSGASNKNKKEIMRLIVHGTKYIQGSSRKEIRNQKVNVG
jgi:hypothetical protein